MRARLVNEGYGQKDITRMEDIRTKSAGDHEKELKLATTQANIIKNPGKAKARAEAAEEVFGPGNDIAEIFHNRAKELGGSSIRSEASGGFLAPVKGPKEKGKKLEREFKTKYLLPSESINVKSAEEGGRFSRGTNSGVFSKLGIGRYGGEQPEIGGNRINHDISILPLGNVNIGSGKSKYFNIYDTYDGTAEVWMDLNSEKYKLVFTAGDNPLANLNDIGEFRHDQTWSRLGTWKLVDYVPVADMKELIRVYGGSMYGYTYK